MSVYDSSGSSGYLFVGRPSQACPVSSQCTPLAGHPSRQHRSQGGWFSAVASSSPPPPATSFSPQLTQPLTPSTAVSPPAVSASMPYAGGLVPPAHVPQHVPPAARAAIASGASLLPPPTEPPPPPPTSSFQQQQRGALSTDWPHYSNTHPSPDGRPVPHYHSQLQSLTGSGGEGGGYFNSSLPRVCQSPAPAVGCGGGSGAGGGGGGSGCVRTHRLCSRLLMAVFVCVAAGGACLVVADALLRHYERQQRRRAATMAALAAATRLHALLSIGVMMLFVAGVMLFVLCRRSAAAAAKSDAHVTTSAHQLLASADTSATSGQCSKQSFTRSPLVGAAVAATVEQIPLTRVAGGGFIAGAGGVYSRAADGVLVCSSTLPRRFTGPPPPAVPSAGGGAGPPHVGTGSALHTPLMRRDCLPLSHHPHRQQQQQQLEEEEEAVYQESEYSHPWDHVARRNFSQDNLYSPATLSGARHDYVNSASRRG